MIYLLFFLSGAIAVSAFHQWLERKSWKLGACLSVSCLGVALNLILRRGN